MAHELDIKHLDRRTQARYVNRGALAEKELERYLRQLPDLQENAVNIEIEQPSNDGAPTR